MADQKPVKAKKEEVVTPSKELHRLARVVRKAKTVEAFTAVSKEIKALAVTVRRQGTSIIRTEKKEKRKQEKLKAKIAKLTKQLN